MFDKDERESLYNGITAILTDYNQRRFKKSEIKLIEEIATKKEVEEISQIISDHMTKEKLSNGILICWSLERMAETLMTFYNQSPNTSYLQIDGFNAPGDEGPTINAALNFLDKFEDEYESSLSSKKTKLEKQKGKLRGEIDSSTSKRTKEKKEEEIKSIDQKLNDSEKDLNKEYFNNVIKNISDLFFYPEITDQSALDKHTKDTIALKKAKIVKI